MAPCDSQKIDVVIRDCSSCVQWVPVADRLLGVILLTSQ